MAIVLLVFVPASAAAQAIRIQADDESLRPVLLTLRDQARVDIVFSEALVEGRRTNCTYEGNAVREAFDCILAATGLEVQRVRRHQYVLVRGGNEAGGDGTSSRRWTLWGFVVDHESGEVLPGAHVYLPELRLGTVTNDAGYFALASLPPGEYVVRFSFLGYVSIQERMMNASTGRTMYLAPVLLEGDDVVVEDERFPPAGSVATPGMLRPSIRRLEALPSFPGESDLFQVLQWFPGIRKTGEINGGMVIRGAPPDQHLYILDGAPVYHPWHAFSLISVFQTETFKDIKLYRDSFPVEYGGRIASVLDAQMKDGSREEPQVRLGLSALSGRIVVESPATENSSFMVSARRSYIDMLIGRQQPVEDELGRRDTLRTGYYFYDASAKYTHRFGHGNRLSLSYYQGGDDLDLRLPFNLSLDFSSWLRPANLFFEVVQHWTNRLLSTRYQHLFSNQVFATGTAYVSTYSARESALLRPTASAEMQSDYRVNLRDAGLKVDVEYFRSIAHRVQAGIHVGVRGFDSSIDAVIQRSVGSVDRYFQENPVTKTEMSAYVQGVWHPTDRWTIRPGVRLDVFGFGLYADVSPRLAIEYAIDPRLLRLKAGIGRSMQHVHRLRDRYAFTYDLVTSRWVPVDEAVPPASGFHVSGGFDSWLLQGVFVEGDGYWRDVDHVLIPEDEFQSKSELVGPGIDTGELVAQYVSGDARAYGIELSIRSEWGPWSVRASYAGGKSLVRSAHLDETTLRAARYDVPRSLRGLVERRFGPWRLSSGLEMRSGYPTTVPVGQYLIGDLLDEDDRYLHRPLLHNHRLPPYFRLDLSAERSFRALGADWTARLHLYNATGLRNVIAQQYIPSEDGMLVRSRRGLPILPLFEIEMTW